MTEYVCKSLEDISHTAEELTSKLESQLPVGALVLAFQGDLGAGKTTLTQSLAKVFGVEETVTSPTFVIEKIYKLAPGKKFEHLIHIDCYRLKDGMELKKLGWSDIVNDSKNIVIVEWPERVAEILPEDAVYFYFNHIDETTRSIKVEL